MILGFEIFQLSRTCQKLGHFIVLCNCLSHPFMTHPVPYDAGSEVNEYIPPTIFAMKTFSPDSGGK